MSDAHAPATTAEETIRRWQATHGAALRAWAGRRLSDPRDAEEAVAETFVRAWRNLERFAPERGSERAWLFGILRRAAADQHRRGRRHLRVVDASGSEAVAPDDELDRFLETSHVLDALRRLGDDHRRAVIETFYRGATTAQAARRLGVPPGTVKSRLYYALRRLRADLEEQGVLR